MYAPAEFAIYDEFTLHYKIVIKAGFKIGEGGDSAVAIFSKQEVEKLK